MQTLFLLPCHLLGTFSSFHSSRITRDISGIMVHCLDLSPLKQLDIAWGQVFLAQIISPQALQYTSPSHYVQFPYGLSTFSLRFKVLLHRDSHDPTNSPKKSAVDS